MQAEPRVQPIFIRIFSYLLLATAIVAVAGWLKRPSRSPGADRIVIGEAREVAAGAKVRAWTLTAPDTRFGGLSALAVDRGALLALTDSGVVARFAPPGPGRVGSIRFTLHDLPGGPGSSLRKSARDSESLVADPAGRGWWVGFENRHSLWLFDADFGTVLANRRLAVGWGVNRGAEALVATGDGRVMALPESGGRAAGGPLVAPAGTADATRLADGRLALLVRRWTWQGFATRVDIGAGRGRPARRIAVPLAPLDNMEGIAAAPLANGGTRLWIVSDDNFRPWMRTVLVALDLPPGA